MKNWEDEKMSKHKNRWIFEAQMRGEIIRNVSIGKKDKQIANILRHLAKNIEITRYYLSRLVKKNINSEGIRTKFVEYSNELKTMIFYFYNEKEEGEYEKRNLEKCKLSKCKALLAKT